LAAARARAAAGLTVAAAAGVLPAAAGGAAAKAEAAGHSRASRAKPEANFEDMAVLHDSDGETAPRRGCAGVERPGTERPIRAVSKGDCRQGPASVTEK
jgi:hypothetical protein